MRGLTVLVAATIVSLAACRTIETKLPPVELPEFTFTVAVPATSRACAVAPTSEQGRYGSASGPSAGLAASAPP